MTGAFFEKFQAKYAVASAFDTLNPPCIRMQVRSVVVKAVNAGKDYGRFALHTAATTADSMINTRKVPSDDESFRIYPL